MAVLSPPVGRHADPGPRTGPTARAHGAGGSPGAAGWVVLGLATLVAVLPILVGAGEIR